ncbi:histone-like nucleoid-structuring protein Lsr2 [Streptomyces cyaneofuscatus]|uniref:Lsr2 family DNA-binding protein n=1 Tax=Streptomyces cyaneofuscatus TaxID=66883 RepID=UPI003658ABBC
MFTDWAEAQEAESLALNPNAARQLAAAARVTARSSHDKHDMTLLLDALGLPTDPDTITALLPLIPETGGQPAMTTTAAPQTPTPALSAFEAMAISMHANGDSDQTIREATGLSDTELRDLIADQALTFPRSATATPSVDTSAIDVPVIPLPASHPAQELLDWAAAHPAAQVRNRAARITTDLAELTERRDTEAAQREAEVKVARAKAELERAQEELRTVKAGPRTTAAGPTSGRTGSGSGRSREELAAIRAWARAHGHQVADAGMVPRRIQEAYDAAHQDSARKAG